MFSMKTSASHGVHLAQGKFGKGYATFQGHGILTCSSFSHQKDKDVNKDVNRFIFTVSTAFWLAEECKIFLPLCLLFLPHNVDEKT